MNPETKIQGLIQLAVSAAKTLIFRNETGRFWAGKVIHKAGDQVTLKNARMVSCGLCVGSSDLIGVTPIVITPEMVGETVGVFTAIEVKTPTGPTTKEQLTFITNIKNAGGLAGIARSPADALNIINGVDND